jgi:glycosyltransferase involved in cell wall biosynthesis
MPEIVEDGKNGLLARNRDVDSYVSCLQRLIEDRFLTEQLGEAGRQTTERSHTDVRIATLSTRFYLQQIGREPLTKAEPVSPV